MVVGELTILNDSSGADSAEKFTNAYAVWSWQSWMNSKPDFEHHVIYYQTQVWMVMKTYSNPTIIHITGDSRWKTKIQNIKHTLRPQPKVQVLATVAIQLSRVLFMQPTDQSQTLKASDPSQGGQGMPGRVRMVGRVRSLKPASVHLLPD